MKTIQNYNNKNRASYIECTVLHKKMLYFCVYPQFFNQKTLPRYHVVTVIALCVDQKSINTNALELRKEAIVYKFNNVWVM